MGNFELHRCLLDINNNMLATGELEPHWRHTLFKMLPKHGDHSKAGNWRPIALPDIAYKVFAKMFHNRLAAHLDSLQSVDQVGLRPRVGVEFATAVFEDVCRELWVATVDLKKPLDRVEYEGLFAALSRQHVPQNYLNLPRAICSGQVGTVEGHAPFDIERGVKQGDILSSLLFNASLEEALSKWKIRVAGMGLNLCACENLSNVRYAHDLLLYTSLSEIWFS